MRGLVRLAAIKVGADLPHLREDEDFFSTTVQETLHFERELCEVHEYPHTQPSILCVLTDCRVFPRWLALERKCTCLFVCVFGEGDLCVCVCL